MVGSKGHGGPCAWSVCAGSGTSPTWRWWHSWLPGRLGWDGLWLLAGVGCLHVRSIGTRQVVGCTVLVGACQKLYRCSQVGCGSSFQLNMHEQKKLDSTPGSGDQCSLPTFITGPCANKRYDALGRAFDNAGKGELCVYLFYRPGQKLRAELQLLLSCWPTCFCCPAWNASLPGLGEL